MRVVIRLSVIPFLFLLLRCEAMSRKKSAGRCEFKAIFNFGDSNSDTGAIAASFYRWLPPQGMTYFHKPMGRACDGLLIVDFYAMQLGLPFLHPYLDPIGANFREGANFATGGSTIRPQNTSFNQGGASPFSLNFQLTQFLELKERANESHYQGFWYKNLLPQMKHFADALYTIDIGQNDIVSGLRSMTPDQVRESFPDILAQLSSVIQTLYWQAGARSFWIHNTGPLGCVPFSIIFNHAKPEELDEAGCIRAQNDLAEEFNQQLKEMVEKLRRDLPFAALTYVDIYSAKYALISEANNLGFVDPFKICCGHAGMDYLVTCGNSITVNGSQVHAPTCTDPLTYISWDGVHYTHSANQLIADQIIDGSLSDPPIPLEAACHRVVE